MAKNAQCVEVAAGSVSIGTATQITDIAESVRRPEEAARERGISGMRGAEKQQPIPAHPVDFQRLKDEKSSSTTCAGGNLCNSAVYFEAAGVAAPMFGSFGIESDRITVGGFIDELRSAQPGNSGPKRLSGRELPAS